MPLDIIKDTLHDFPEEKVSDAKAFLTSLGVTCVDDFNVLEESDLLPFFNLVQARKLIKCGKIKSLNHSDTSTEPMWSPCSTGSENECWVIDIEIPWVKCSPVIMDALQSGKVLSSILRREFIHLLVDENRMKTTKAGRKDFLQISCKVHRKYPESFQDKIDGELIGTGYDLLADQLYNRWENKNRKVNRKRSNQQKETEQSSPYACVNWSPHVTRENDDAIVNLQASKQWLQEEYEKITKDREKICLLMNQTYPLQRECINKVKPIHSITSEWPFLQEPEFLVKHYNKLIGFQDESNLCEEFAERSQQIYKVMKQSNKDSIKSTIKRIRDEGKILQTSVPKAVSMLVLLTKYFDEDEAVLRKCYVDHSSFKECEKSDLPLSPFIAILGETAASASGFKVVVEGDVLCTCTNYFDAVAAMFTSFYVFNLEYPQKASLTMEFIQRFVAKINAYGGRTKKRGKQQSSPRVLRLIKKIADYKRTLMSANE